MKLQKTDIPKLLMLIRVNFENAYNFKSEEEAKLLVEYWYDCLKEYSQEVVKRAVANAIKSAEFAPKIKNILDEVEKLMTANKKTDEELWTELCGVCWEAYNAFAYINQSVDEDIRRASDRRLNEIWDRLSPEIKTYVVDAAGLAEIGRMNGETLQYEKARFLKSMPRIRETLKDRQEAMQFLRLTGADDLTKLLGNENKKE